MTIKSNIFKLVKKKKFKEIYKIIEKNSSFNVNIFNKNNISLLEICILNDEIKLIKLLISKNVRIDFLASNNLSILDHIIRFNKIDILKIFLEHNSNSIGTDILSINGKFNLYPIHLAVIQMKLDILKLIIKYSSKINFKDYKGNNIMHIAASSKKYNDILRYLIKNHKELYTFNNNEESPLHLAIINNFPKNTIKLFTDNFDFNIIPGNKNIMPIFIAIIEDNQSIYELLDTIDINLNLQDYTGNNALYYCIENENYRYFDKLFNKINFKKFKVNSVNILGQTLLHSLFDNLNFLKYSIKNNHINNIIKFSNLNLQDNIGNSCFLLLCKFDLWNTYYNILESKPINAFLKNYQLQKPIDFVSKNNLDTFYNLLQSSFYYFIKNKTKYKVDKSILNNCSKINDKCKTFILNYIKKNSISVMPRNLSYCHNIVDNNVSYVTFIGLQLDIFFGLIYLKKKYKNIVTTNELNIFSSNHKLEQFYDDNGIDKDFMYEIPNLEIKWTFQKLILPDNFNKLFKIKKNIIIVPIGIILQEGSHSNMLIFNNLNKSVLRFEPYGSEYPFQFNYNPNLLDLKIEEMISNFDLDYLYIPPKTYLNKLSFQAFEINEDDKQSQLGDPGGFCAAWSLWFAENYILNVHKIDNLYDFIYDLILEIRIKNISFKNMIRAFSAKIANFRDKYLKKINININQWNNSTLDIKTYDKTITYFENLS